MSWLWCRLIHAKCCPCILKAVHYEGYYTHSYWSFTAFHLHGVMEASSSHFHRWPESFRPCHTVGVCNWGTARNACQLNRELVWKVGNRWTGQGTEQTHSGNSRVKSANPWTAQHPPGPTTRVCLTRTPLSTQRGTLLLPHYFLTLYSRSGSSLVNVFGRALMTDPMTRHRDLQI